MNSANSETMNRTRKIHNDQKPRPFALKFCQRRILIGENSNLLGRMARPTGPVGSRSGVNPRAAISFSPPGSGRLSALVRSSTSHLPRLEVDARIDPGVGQIGNQIHDEAYERENVEIGEHDRIIAIEHALEAEQAEPVEREDRFDQQRAGEEGADERGRDAGAPQKTAVA